MCLLVYLPDNTKLSDEEIERAFRSNPDGVGIAWWDRRNRIWRIVKGLMDVNRVKGILSDLGEIRKVVHFRLGVVGPKHPKLTHPFITPNVVLFQNGVWSDYRKLEYEIESKRNKTLLTYWEEFNEINKIDPLLNSDTKLMAFLMFMNEKTKGQYRSEVKEMLRNSGKLVILRSNNPEPIFISQFYEDSQGRKFSNKFFTFG